MMISKRLFLLFLLCITMFIYPDISHQVLSEVIKPIQLLVTKEYIYVCEKYKINIYNKQTLKFIKSFGKKGQGPNEFPRIIVLHSLNNNLIVSSFNKLLWYTKAGIYIKEKQFNNPFIDIRPLSIGFFMNKIYFSSIKNNKVKSEMSILDKNLNLKKIIYKKYDKFKRSGNNRERKVFFDTRVVSTVDKKHILIGEVGGKKAPCIKIFNHNGKLINSIKREYQKISITNEYKQSYIDMSNQDMLSYGGNRIKQYLKTIKYIFPKYFYPYSFIVSDPKTIYIFKDVQDFNKFEIIIINKKGKKIKQIEVNKSRCFCIKDGIYYYISENIDEENWELFSKKLL